MQLDDFLKDLGDVDVLTQEHETFLFSHLRILLFRFWVRNREKIPLNDVKSEAYKQCFIEAERKYHCVYEAVLKTDSDFSRDLAWIYDHFVKHNVRLVISLIKKRYFNKTLDIVDLLNEGIMGLIKTVQRFEYTRKFKFSTYAIHWINQGIFRAVSQGSKIIRLPPHAMNSSKRYREILAQISDNDSTTMLEDRYLRRVFHMPRRRINLEKDVQNFESGMPVTSDSLVGYDTSEMMDSISNSYRDECLFKGLAMLSPFVERQIRIKFGLGWTQPRQNKTHKNKHLLLGLCRIKVWLKIWV
jgi:RNA polymerase sigma factor (sigma-70 family)